MRASLVWDPAHLSGVLTVIPLCADDAFQLRHVKQCMLCACLRKRCRFAPYIVLSDLCVYSSESALVEPVFVPCKSVKVMSGLLLIRSINIAVFSRQHPAAFDSAGAAVGYKDME